MNVMICDDEALARDRLRSLITMIGGHHIVAEAGNGREAVELCRRHEPDIVLLDIRMPVMDGIEAARYLARMNKPPAVIFTTAYDDYTLQAFEANAVDYLLKPIREQRLAEALARARRPTRAQLRAIEEGSDKPKARTHICVQQRGDLKLIPVDEVCYFMADQKYISVRHAQGEVLIEESLKSLEQEFGDRFVRIHRNALVARKAIDGMIKRADGRHLVTLHNCPDQLEISRRHLPAMRRLLKGK